MNEQLVLAGEAVIYECLTLIKGNKEKWNQISRLIEEKQKTTQKLISTTVPHQDTDEIKRPADIQNLRNFLFAY